MNFLIQVRNEFFKEVGQKRWKRILMIAFVIATIWCSIDYFIYDNLTTNLKHDIVVLVISIFAERLIPWGKSDINIKSI